MNLVLIGMPSSGKSTIAKLLSDKINKPFVDLDEEIIKEAKMSIPEIFSLYKEEGFRDLESKVAYTFSLKDNLIISCGGGIIKRKENMIHLKRNGKIIFIDRDLDKLVSYDPNRPLSGSKEAVEKLYKERYSLYLKYADIIIKNNTDINESINTIISLLDKESTL